MAQSSRPSVRQSFVASIADLDVVGIASVSRRASRVDERWMHHCSGDEVMSDQLR